MPEIDLTGEDWENKPIQDVLGGLVLNQDSESMQANQFLELDGLTYRKGVMQKDTGYSDFADTPKQDPGILRKVFKHISATGVSNTFAISNSTLFVLSGTAWQPIALAGGASTTLNAAHASGASSINCVSVAGFSVADLIAIELDDGSYAVMLIDSISTPFLVPAVGRTLGGAAASGNNVFQILRLSGTSDKQVDALTIPWNDWLAFTNGIDPPQYYDPSTTNVQIIPNLPSSGDTICEGLALFDTSLILLRTTEGGTNFNQRVRWSDKADATEWVTGDAGAVDLLDAADNIQNGLGLGPYLIVYRAKSIYRGTAVNTVRKRFQWDRMVSAHGALSSASMVDIGDKHLVVGNKEVYIYGGGFDVAPVGAPIKDLLYGPEAELDTATAHRTFCIYVEARNDVMVFYQTAAATAYPNKMLRWFGDLNVWITRSYDSEMAGFGEATNSNSLTWNDLTGSWEDQTWNWNSSSIASDLETIIFCPTDGQTVEYDFLNADNDGEARTYMVETPDFSHFNGELRLDYLEVRAAGTSIKYEISIDEGASWITAETFSPGAALIKTRLFYQVSSRTMRFRFSGSSSFKMSWMNLRITLETEN